VVTALERKLLRDLLRLRGQLVSIGAVVACGIAGVLAMGGAQRSLRGSRDAFYVESHFADIFASVERAPRGVVRRAAELPGVAEVEARVHLRATLDVPGLGEPATGWFLSVDPERTDGLARLHVRSGRMLDARADDEVLVNEHFIKAARLRLGDTVGAALNGRWRRLRVVGVVHSPEFVHDNAPGFPAFGDSRHFGIFWMTRAALSAARGMDGAFNDLLVRLAPDASEDAVRESLDSLLAPYGGGHAYGREDQGSHRVVEGELAQLGAFGRVMPAIFLGVAAFLLNVVLSRLVATQREEIAVLKAFGYSNRTIGWHVLGYAAAPLLLGVVVGVPLGAWLGRGFTNLYRDVFMFPRFDYHVSGGLVFVAVLVSALAAVTGALQAVRAAASLPPAEGMRPPQPPTFRPLLLERLGYGHLLSPAARMVLRTVERRPARTALSVLGVAMAGAVMIAGTFAFDSARELTDLTYRVASLEDVTVAFTGPRPARVRAELARLPGVTRVELFREAAAEIRAGHRRRQVAVLGLEQDGQMRRLVSADHRVYPAPNGGVVLGATLAEILRVRVGDTVLLRPYERGVHERPVPVTGVVGELLGLNAYMERGELAALLDERPSASGAFLRADSSSVGAVLRALAARPGVASAYTRQSSLQNFEESMARSVDFVTMIVGSIAAVIALGVLYNGARIALSERARELASLRVLGFTRAEVWRMLAGEQAIVDLLGAPLGLGIGVLFALLIVRAFETELYRFPLIISARTCISAVGLVLVAGVIASLAMRRRVNRFDLVAVLKTRE
jgi:putative ABC transport system permease protein